MLLNHNFWHCNVFMIFLRSSFGSFSSFFVLIHSNVIKCLCRTSGCKMLLNMRNGMVNLTRLQICRLDVFLFCPIPWEFWSTTVGFTTAHEDSAESKIIFVAFALILGSSSLLSTHFVLFSWMQKEAVYGLTEIYRKEIQDARLVANPGCYPTSIQIPLVPLLEVCLFLKTFWNFLSLHSVLRGISWLKTRVAKQMIIFGTKAMLEGLTCLEQYQWDLLLKPRLALPVFCPRQF